MEQWGLFLAADRDSPSREGFGGEKYRKNRSSGRATAHWTCFCGFESFLAFVGIIMYNQTISGGLWNSFGTVIHVSAWQNAG